MSKLAHKLDTYKEGWQQIEFCTVCGAEGLDLNEDCVQCWPRPDKEDAQLELFSDSYSKKVDKSEEQP